MASLVTRIHGRYYDVGEFDHPGGCPALECARDRDATALFESYHALHRSRPLRTLARYEISPEQAAAPQRFLAETRFGDDAFDWSETLDSPLRRDVIDCAAQYLQQECARRGLSTLRAAAKAPPRRWLEIVLLGMLFFASLPLLVRNGFRDHVMRIRGWFNDAVPLVIEPRWRRWLHVAGRLTVAASLFAWPFALFPPAKAVVFALVPSLILSELFLLFSQVNHVTIPNLEAGDKPCSDWYESQVRASCSYATGSYAAFIMSGGLNLQIEHHLLPGLNHAHLFKLSPQIRSICARHGVPYHDYASFGAALRAHLATMRRLAQPPVPH